MKDGTRVLLALIAAIALGALVGASGNASLISAADSLAPIGTLWVNAIRMTVVPLVVSLVITGVASTADIRSIGRLGGRTLAVFLLLLVVNAVIIIPTAAAIFSFLPPNPSVASLPAGATQAASELVSNTQPQTLGAWLVSLVPSNPIAAAANGAMLPLIIFTLLFAVAIAKSVQMQRETLLGFFRAIADAMMLLVSWVVRLAPIGVFALVLPLAAHAGATLVGGIGLYIVTYSVLSIVSVFALYPLVALFGGIPIRQFARAALAPQLIALSSSSSLATLPALVQSVDRNLGLPKSATGFVLPLSVSMFKVAGPLAWTVGALFIGWFYGVQLDAKALATIGAAAVFLAFGVPGIPRGSFIMVTPLFVSLGLPAEGVGILIAVDALPDVFATALNATGYLASTAIIVHDPATVPLANVDLATETNVF